LAATQASYAVYGLTATFERTVMQRVTV